MSEVTDAKSAAAADEGGPGPAGAGAPAEAATFLNHKQIMIILPGLLMAMLLAMLDQLVVGTALPRIVGDLGGATHLSWVVTAYVLASTITVPPDVRRSAPHRQARDTPVPWEFNWTTIRAPRQELPGRPSPS